MAVQGLTALKNYARKHVKRKQLEEQVEKLKLECEALAPAVLKYFERHGVDRQSIDGYTVAPRLELWASRAGDKTQQDMHDALIDAGLREYATESMNHQSMSAYIREVYRNMLEAESQKPKGQQRLLGTEQLLEEVFALHPELEGILAVREDLKISVTKSKKSTARTRIKDVLAKKAALPKEVEEDNFQSGAAGSFPQPAFYEEN